ncbi:uncharacterized protein A1O5_09397 [Cladophialophora psammophila CBS 110553]|uniref:Uncharacterized protein n=1 Tax=Cladophialophora psammophila CBS 110553 TaxID=1182543 RepID=W9XAD8_9EURO|nr:uncharacterized protein A1O5_09397 [Cladophialophora psammophila CBS 110553]EXJ67384.1 hypothetical protein A1O5_09397 [Cladophialophora psammophila CBS 110553]
MLPKTFDDARADSAARAQECGWEKVNARGFEILEAAHGFHAPKRAIVIGAGATGICFAKFAEPVPNLEVQIYDKNDEVAGTWWENRYPGCACDIPSHIYQFQWALNPYWSHYYVGAAEILQYFRDVVDKHDLCKYMKLSHEVLGASWDSTKVKWIVTVKAPDGSTFEDSCDFLINASGLLNKWKWPEIKGLESFTGVRLHSANYDPSIDLQGKTVAVIGSGSSGLQIVTSIQPVVEHLYTWIRSPIWVSAGFASNFAGKDGQNLRYTPEFQNKLASDPVAHLRYIKMIDEELGIRFNYNLVRTAEAQGAIDFSRQLMKEKLKSRPELFEKIVPKTYGVGCRRVTPGNGYLEALVAPNVTVYPEDIQEITPTGFINKAGEEHAVDVIICATGFDTSFVPRFPLTANGKDLRSEWKTDPVSYFSLMVPDFPNYFISLGPYSASNGSLLPPIEHGCRYMIQVIEKCQLEKIKYLSPKVEATHQFREYADLLLKRTVWSQPCRSWFKGNTIDGLPRNYPGSRAHFVELVVPRYEDFEIEYESVNRFHFWGNGFTLHEVDGRDPTWYLGIVDGEDKQPDYTKDEEEFQKLLSSSPTPAPDHHEPNGLPN